MNFQDVVLKKFTTHKLFTKKYVEGKEILPYADECKAFSDIGPDGMQILASRVMKAFSQSKRFFNLEIKEQGDNSFWKIGAPIIGSRRPYFLEIANDLANQAAAVHTKANTPDGLLLVIDAVVSGYKSLIIVKAEKSSAFSMKESAVELVKDIFLSSDKTLYKIGLLVHKDDKNITAKSYSAYVYDDAFSPSKDNLALYFYEKFLGFSAEKNGALNTNKLYNELKDFNNKIVENLSDRNDIFRNIDRILNDKRKVTLHAEDFKLLFPIDSHLAFEHFITTNFPLAIVKDLTLLGDFQTKRIPLTANADLIAKNGISGKIKFVTVRAEDMKHIKTLDLDSGLYRGVYIPITSDINDTTKDKSIAPKKK